ncbi:MAG: YdeI/OmpD-associated family protein [Ktedonobacteraceae bacterium]|nr:YdeI/OmpD-associated family protein [Ktedonobacteraceae bacterium]
MKSSEELPIRGFATQQDWESWLAEHCADPTGIWLKIAKKSAGVLSISYAEALEGALCYGWIDGQKAAFDEHYWLQKFTSRRTKSIWSQINCNKVTTLIEAGRMQPSGLRQVELAQADGRWEAAYASQSKASVPDDLQEALDKNPQALAFFLTLNSVNRYAILFRVQTARKAETRATRIQQFVEMLARGEKFHP